MSCAVSQGYTKTCRDSIGGIKAVYFTELSNKNTITEASSVITVFTLTAGKKFWKYEQELTVATAEETPTPNAANGSYFVEQTCEITIPQHTASIAYSIKTLAVNDLMTIVEKIDGTFWLLGKNNGMKMQPSKNPYGKALGDMTGYVLTFKGMEADLASQVTGSLMTTLVLPA